jgi:hypothetical protein
MQQQYYPNEHGFAHAPSQVMMQMQPQHYPSPIFYPSNQQGHAMMPMPQYMPQVQPQPAILAVDYLPETGCCCRGCCGGQPGNRERMAVYIDGVEVGQLNQGQSATYFFAAGAPHSVSTKICGVGGFFKSLVGNDGVGQVSCAPGPGQHVHIWISWKDTSSCCAAGTRWYPKMTQEATFFKN